MTEGASVDLVASAVLSSAASGFVSAVVGAVVSLSWTGPAVAGTWATVSLSEVLIV